jgi:translation initiation factor 2 subunit 1
MNHSYTNVSSSDPEQVFKEITLTPEQKSSLIEAISRKMAPSPVKIRADFELNCFTYEGIDAIRHALLAAKSAVNDDNIKVDVSL